LDPKENEVGRLWKVIDGLGALKIPRSAFMELMEAKLSWDMAFSWSGVLETREGNDAAKTLAAN